VSERDFTPAERAKIDAMRRELVSMEKELKKRQLEPSWWGKTVKKWDEYWDKFEKEAKTNKEMKAAIRKRRTIRAVGSVAAVGMFPVTVWTSIIAMPTFMVNNKITNWRRSSLEGKIARQQERIEDEIDEIRYRRTVRANN
jgi:hypothetical protein